MVNKEISLFPLRAGNSRKAYYLALSTIVLIAFLIAPIFAASFVPSNEYVTESSSSSFFDIFSFLGLGTVMNTGDYRCEDDDHGKTYRVTGGVIVDNLKTGYFDIFGDYCKTPELLIEYSCQNKPTTPVLGTTVQCTYGCGDGACLDKSTSVTPHYVGEGEICDWTVSLCSEGFVCTCPPYRGLTCSLGKDTYCEREVSYDGVPSDSPEGYSDTCVSGQVVIGDSGEIYECIDFKWNINNGRLDIPNPNGCGCLAYLPVAMGGGCIIPDVVCHVQSFFNSIKLWLIIALVLVALVMFSPYAKILLAFIR
jgi:hypothetical protein